MLGVLLKVSAFGILGEISKSIYEDRPSKAGQKKHAINEDRPAIVFMGTSSTNAVKLRGSFNQCLVHHSCDAELGCRTTLW